MSTFLIWAAVLAGYLTFCVFVAKGIEGKPLFPRKKKDV